MQQTDYKQPNNSDVLNQFMKATNIKIAKLAEDTGLNKSFVYKLCKNQTSFTKNTCDLLNNYFETIAFRPTRLVNGEQIPFTARFIAKNKKANKFKFGNTVIYLGNREVYTVSRITFSKKEQTWIYDLVNSDRTTLYNIPENRIKEYVKEEEPVEDLFNTPQVTCCPEEPEELEEPEQVEQAPKEDKCEKCEKCLKNTICSSDGSTAERILIHIINLLLEKLQ